MQNQQIMSAEELYAGNLDTSLYVEPSQPPRGPAGVVTGIPSVVGGKRVNKEAGDPHGAWESTFAGEGPDVWRRKPKPENEVCPTHTLLAACCALSRANGSRHPLFHPCKCQ